MAFINCLLVFRRGVAEFPKGVEDAKGLTCNRESCSLAGTAVTAVKGRVPEGEGAVVGGWDREWGIN